MYTTDDAYKQAIAGGDRTSAISGTITTKRGVKIPIDDTVLVRDTLSITNQSLNGTSFELGTVYAAEAGLTFVTDADRYELYGGKLELAHSIGGTSVPLGQYTITEAYRVGSKVSIKACDDMLLFDVDVNEDTTGTAWELLAYVCDKCGVPLGMTQDQVDALPNATNLYAILEDRVQTYRDAISYIAIVTCTFATINRSGALALVSYAAESSLTLTNADRMSNAEFSDYKVLFAGVYGRFVAEQNFYPYSHTEDNRDGLLLNLGDVPIVQGTEAMKHSIIDAIWDAIKDIEYTPCNIKIKPDAAIELGDRITNAAISNGNETAVSLVQYYQWNYRRPMVIKSLGDNARLATVKARQNRELAELEASISAQQISVQQYTNAQAYTIKGEDADIVMMNFVAVSACRPVFIAQVQYELDLDGLVIFSFYFDNVEREDLRLYRYRCAGQDFATLAIAFDMTAGARTTLKVKARVEYVASEKRASDAKQTTLINFADAVNEMLAGGELKSVEYETAEPDTTQPTLEIMERGVSAAGIAQGIATAEAVWDGALTLTEVIAPIGVNVPAVTVNRFTDSVTVAQQIPDKSGLHDTFGKIDIDIPDVIVSGIDFVSYLADKAGLVLTDKDGNKLSERGKNGK